MGLNEVTKGHMRKRLKRNILAMVLEFSWEKVARLERFELPALGTGIRCSIRTELQAHPFGLKHPIRIWLRFQEMRGLAG